VVVAAGTAALLDCLFRLYSAPTNLHWLVLAALTLFSGSFTIKVPSIPATISVSETFVFTCVLLYGTPAATVTVALDGLIMSSWRHRRHVHKVLFNAAEPALSIYLASELFFRFSGIQPLTQQSRDVSTIILPTLLLASAYFLLNSGLTALAVSFDTGSSVISLWKDHFLWLSLNYFVGASVAALIVQNTTDISLATMSIILPLLLISYLTFKTSMGRVEDSDRHLAELNKLHLSTIETLAMAIDAKDQVTHGHIRRVQTHAVGLAKSLGLKDRRLLRAVEAAALLHDMGKLAVPEHILNKPGRLTAAEFEKMKLHSGVGADILSAIDFPYPVVPIVRHHHENWDGNGYPDGLSGLDIPIGARILAVVDCFDALTSDRPYRPRLTDEDALRILQARRGSMYDPLVVDTFLRVYQGLASSGLSAGADRIALAEIARSVQARPEAQTTSSVPSTEVAGNGGPSLGLYELLRSLSRQSGLANAAEIIASYFHPLLPLSLCVLYVLDDQSNQLVATRASGEHADAATGLRIALGQRLSGWVAANRQTMLNSDPALDLGDVIRSLRPELRNCLSLPLAVEGSLVGVLALYTTSAAPYTDSHRRIAEAAGQQIAHAIKQVVEVDVTRAGVSGERQRNVTVGQRIEPVSPLEGLPSGLLCPVAVVLVHVNGLASVARYFGRTVQDVTAAKIADVLRGSLRDTDILFRQGVADFVVLLTQTGAGPALSIATRVRNELIQANMSLPDGSRLEGDVVVGFSSAPPDGTSLTDLIGTARHRLSRGSGPISASETVPRSVH
jgi:diguanylate cyclase (GGDEF)-like protein/putative nucleotidyltransferase with HDIG domain